MWSHAHTLTRSHAHTLTRSHAHTLTRSHAQRTVSAFCEVTWEGIPNSVSHEGRSENGAKFSAEDCCTEALAKPAQDAQSAWNKQSEYFKDAVSQQTSIGVQATEGFASGTLTQSSENSQE